MAIGTALVVGCASAAASPPATGLFSIAPTQTSSAPVSSATAAATAGVSGTSTAASSAPPGAITIRSSGFAYVPSSVTAKAGTISFFFVNVPDVAGPPIVGHPHDIAIGTTVGQPLVLSQTIKPGLADVYTVENLPAGTYRLFSMVGADPYKDWQLGMVGGLTVTP